MDERECCCFRGSGCTGVARTEWICASHTHAHTPPLFPLFPLFPLCSSRLMAAMCVGVHQCDNTNMHVKQNLKAVASVVTDLEHMFGDSHYLTMRLRLLQGGMCVCVCMYVCMYVYVYLCMCVCMYMCVCVYVYVCV